MSNLDWGNVCFLNADIVVWLDDNNNLKKLDILVLDTYIKGEIRYLAFPLLDIFNKTPHN